MSVPVFMTSKFPETSSMRARALRASVWSVSGLVLSHSLRLVSNIVLARLLYPEAFGLMAIVTIFLLGVQLLTDIGIGPAVIQNRRGDDRIFLDTAWTMQIARGFLLWGALSAIAWPVSVMYQEPQLAILIVVVGASAAISGFESTARFTLNRQLYLGKVTALELGAQVVALPIMITWAWWAPSVWPLVAGTLVVSLVRTVWSHQLVRDRHDRIGWDATAARQVFGFGKWIFVISAVGFLATQIDRLLLGKLITFEMLGVYTIAYMLQRIPDEMTARLALKVIFPVISSQRDLPRKELRRRILDNRWRPLAVIAIFVATIVVFGDWIVLSLYDARYEDAAWMLQILALGLWPRILTNVMGAALMGVGSPKYLAYSGTIRFLALVVTVPLSHAAWGVAGVAAVVAGVVCIDYFIDTAGLRRNGLSFVRQDILLTMFLAAIALTFIGFRLSLGFDFGTVPWPGLHAAGI